MIYTTNAHMQKLGITTEMKRYQYTNDFGCLTFFISEACQSRMLQFDSYSRGTASGIEEKPILLPNISNSRQTLY